MTSCAVLQVSCTWSEASLGALLSRLITSPLSKGHSEGFGLSACVKGGVSKSHMIQEVSTARAVTACTDVHAVTALATGLLLGQPALVQSGL